MASFDTYPTMIAIVLTMCLPAQAMQPGHGITGDWKLTSVLDGVDITSIDHEQAKQLLGRIMTISETGVRFGTDTCRVSTFDSKRVVPDLYLRQEARMSAVNLNLPNPVTVVDVGCTRIFLKKSGHAVIFWDGFFFEARRIHSPTSFPR
ncbi:hypothetical protein [Massilia sp. HP4]|uniref:hypothetical protein n=1 Tax=Massilia sp. HP4 TaxID=2562316 RepID=UPI0010C15155|nr:hypothetical protein [Massilia sp. HP4]